MKIAFVMHSLGVGGIESVGINYIKLLQQNGYEITVFNLNPDENRLESQLPAGIDYRKVKFKERECPELYSYGIKKWWWGKYVYPVIHILVSLLVFVKRLFMDAGKYDIAIAFSGHINDLTFVAENFIRADKRIVWCHGSLLSYLAICDAYPILYKKMNAIVTLSSCGENNAYMGHQFLKNIRIAKIYNPVSIREKPIDFDVVNRLKKKYGDFVIMVARAAYPKNHMSAIKAFQILKQRGMEKKLVFVGAGESLNEYREFVLNTGLEDMVFFEGNRLDVQNYVAASYIGILLSYHEGLPTAVAEYMAFGKPCVMSDCDDGEISDAGKYCIITKNDDENMLADVLENLYRDSEMYKKYSELSYRRFKDFEPRNQIRLFDQLLHEL